ncbi:MAG: energy transducer TonB [Betaproteobacteria bacterium]|jgi:protein TonB|nr:energy transducer TonB [Betaproteobacteria bacterium]MBP6646711.1 energy transducer TonB [Burkholderiaceae bacterium]
MRKSSGYQTKDAATRYRGLGFVAVLHLLLAWALISGTARKGLEVLKKPLEAVVIQEVTIAPPPPPVKKELKLPEPKAVTTPTPPPPVPPPFVPPAEVTPPPNAAPAITAAPVPPPAPIVMAPPASVAPVTKPAQKTDIGVACPTQVAPEMPRRALQDGTEGVVKAQILIKDGVVKDVTILSGPRVFHNAVRVAMLKYRCIGDGEVLATQEFNFKLE